MENNNSNRTQIIFATSNENKLREVRMILKGFDADIISLKEAGITNEIVEDGNTFKDNAVIKALTIMKETGKPALADDSGLEVDFLNKEPGVYSARYCGVNTSYRIKNRNIIERLTDVPDEERTARFVCVIALALPRSDRMPDRPVTAGAFNGSETVKLLDTDISTDQNGGAYEDSSENTDDQDVRFEDINGNSTISVDDMIDMETGARVLTVRATMEGRIGYEEKGENGFGYDPIFYLPEYGCYSAELAPEKKNEISHRGKALRGMKALIEEYGLIAIHMN